MLSLSGLSLSVISFMLILLLLLKESYLFVSSGVSFWNNLWFPLEGEFNILPLLTTSISLSLLACCLVVPLGTSIALFSLNQNRIENTVYKKILHILNSLPSVVIGFWGIMILVPFLRNFGIQGPSFLSGVIVLSLMVLPTFIFLFMQSIENISKSYEETAKSLGISYITYAVKILLPVSYPAILSSFLLSLGRALGETIAVLMVTGNIVSFPSKITEPVRSLTANIALEMAYAMDMHRSALFLCALVMMFILLVLYIIVLKLQKNMSSTFIEGGA